MVALHSGPQRYHLGELFKFAGPCRADSKLYTVPRSDKRCHNSVLLNYMPKLSRKFLDLSIWDRIEFDWSVVTGAQGFEGSQLQPHLCASIEVTYRLSRDSQGYSSPSFSRFNCIPLLFGLTLVAPLCHYIESQCQDLDARNCKVFWPPSYDFRLDWVPCVNGSPVREEWRMSVQKNHPCRDYLYRYRSSEGNFASRGPKLTDIVSIVFIISSFAEVFKDDFTV